MKLEQMKEIHEEVKELCFIKMKKPSNEFEFNLRALIFIRILRNRLLKKNLLTKKELKILNIKEAEIYHEILYHDYQQQQNKKIKSELYSLLFNSHFSLINLNK